MTSASALFAAALVAAFATGCATADNDKAVSSEPSPAEYRTGSNIPVRGSKPTTEEERARAAEQAREMQRNSATLKP